MLAPRANSLNKPNRKRKRESRDEAIHFNVQIPLEKRQSARLAKRPVEFTYADLPDEDNRSNKKYFKVSIPIVLNIGTRRLISVAFFCSFYMICFRDV